MRSTSLGILLSITMLSAACRGSASSPLSPSAMSPASSPAAASATINGNVRMGMTAPVVGSAADPMKVQVIGTDIVAVVSPAGQFTLTVPAGQVRLHFFGAGTDANLTIAQIGSGETITISVTVVGTTAALESEHRQTSTEVEIEGRIESLPPTALANTLVVAGRTVRTDPATTIRQGSTVRAFTDLAIGQRVHVKGRMDGTAILASIIEIQNTQTDIGVQLNGIVVGLSGSELSFQFTINGRLVKGDNLTAFYGDGDRLTPFTDLQNNARVEVKGEQRDGFVYAVRIHVNKSDNGEVELSGVVSGVSGTCPALTFMVQGQSVVTSASTRFDDLTCEALRTTVGLTVEVEGTMSGTSLLATKVEREDGDDDDEGDDEGEDDEVELSGAVSGVSGSCPAVTFTVQSRSVVTSASTRYKKMTCADLTSGNGLKVEVEGTASGSSVLATKVEKK